MGTAMDAVLMGPPGVGKGTQAGALASWFGLTHLASGDLLRENVRERTELGLRAHDYMRRGELVPDDVVTGMVLDRMLAPDCAGALLDGFPRTVAQAGELSRKLTAHGRAIAVVVLLTAPTETLLRRMTGRLTCRACGETYHSVARLPSRAGRCDECDGDLHTRADDTESTARNRLAVYARQTAPLIGYYTDRGLLVEVNGADPAESVAAELTAVFEDLGLRPPVGDPR